MARDLLWFGMRTSTPFFKAFGPLLFGRRPGSIGQRRLLPIEVENLRVNNNGNCMKNIELVSQIRTAITRENRQDDCILELIGEHLEVVDSNGRTPIFYAVLSERDQLLEKLLKKGASALHVDFEGRTPLHFAIQQRNLAAAKLLLEAGALVDAKDRHGNTPLWAAVMQFQESEGMIKLLISFGASADSKNLYGKSPMDLALSQRVGDAAKWLNEKI